MRINIDWGYYETLYEEPELKLKRVCIFPGKKIEYHYHKNRDEYWTVQEGIANIITEFIVIQSIDREQYSFLKSVPHGINNNTMNDFIILVLEIGICQDEDIIFI